MELTLAQLFGVNAEENSQSLIISKTDLNLLTSNPNNTAESLLIALLIKAFENFQGSLTDPQGNQIKDPQDITIDYNNSFLYELLLIKPWDSFFNERTGLLYIVNTLIIHQFLPYADTEFS